MNASSRPPTRRIPIQNPEWDVIATDVKRVIRLTTELNRLGFEDDVTIGALASELTGHSVDEIFALIPPLYTEGGRNIRTGARSSSTRAAPSTT